MARTAEVYCALDRPDLAGALALGERLGAHVDGFKVGLELSTASGPEGVRAIAALGLPVLLDAKLHDIPNTVAGAVRAAAGLGVRYITVHCQGGPDMLRAAQEAAWSAEPAPILLGVTVLTSLDVADLEAIGVRSGVLEQVLRLAELAASVGLGGLVCSPRELHAVRTRLDHGTVLAVPGIRPAGSARGDQKRVMTPAEAQAAGADILVVGRPITAADDPVTAARAIRAELEAAA